MSRNDNLKAINELKGKHFIVEDYQRGYKWNLQQIDELLNDISEFQPNLESFYCLQPIVVEDLGEDRYELIDGQQRLTTIFIILKCLNIPVYTISYRTRESSEEFLNEIDQLPSIGINLSSNQLDSELNSFWEEYISNQDIQKDNVDNYYFFRDYIHFWLLENKNKVKDFRESLIDRVKVIWYQEKKEGSKHRSAEEIFISFNQGKIELAQAELIKALFVLEYNKEPNIELRSFKLNQFADEWNSMENQLQNDLFWFFISNDISDGKRSNRIDLLFDIIKEKSKFKSNDKLFSYHRYLSDYKDENLDWEPVRDLFNQLHEWFLDRSFYHLIGFITYRKLTNISAIKELYDKSDDKHSFKLKLKEIIDKKMFQENKESYNPELISYGSHNKEIEALLVLFNIISYENTDSNYRFPFDRLKKEKGWSLEHIHAQNTDAFETFADIKEWIGDIQKLESDFKKHDKSIELKHLKPLRDEVSESSDKERINSQLKPLISNLEEEVAESFGKHNIENLCLLDRRTNSSLGKKFFVEKRSEILNLDRISLEEFQKKNQNNDKSKPFIPLTTKNVFMKYYTKNEVQMTYWGWDDRQEYKNSMIDSIEDYLNTKIS